MFKRVTAISIAAAIVLAMVPGVSFAADRITSPEEGRFADGVANDEKSNITSIVLSVKSSIMVPGESLILSAAILPENAADTVVTWSSSDEAVAVADQNGVVTATGLGNASITAEADGINDICEITVVEHAYIVTFDSQGGSGVPDLKAAVNSLITEPEAPVKEGHTFEGWYKDKKCTDRWKFNNDMVTGDTTLWALWRQEGSYFSGCGTETNPYLISSSADLAQLAELVNTGDALYNDKHYTQTQHIDLSDYASWTPIGAGGTPIRLFKGTYDGNGRDITGLNIDIDTAEEWLYIGLFGCLQGVVKNINIVNGNIHAANCPLNNTGGVVGYLYEGLIENCSSNVNISVGSKAASGRISIGGIVGCANCKNGTVNNCLNSGDLIGKANSQEVFVGGVIGLAQKSVQINKCANIGSIHCEGYASAGGITGLIYRSDTTSPMITESYNTGDISIKVSGSGHMHSGGIAGYAASTRITDCFNTGSVSEMDNGKSANVGGIVGKGADTGFYINDCYNIGMVSGGARKGGIAGLLENTSAVSTCYYTDTCVAGIGSGSGMTYKKSLEELRLQSAYDGFDFDTVWTMGAAQETGFVFAQLQGNLLYPQRHEVELVASEQEGTVTGSGDYVVYDNVTITAAEKEQYIFVRWVLVSGDAELANPLSRTTSFIMQNSDVTVQAVFEKVKYNVSVESGSNGTVGGAGSYAWGSNVSIKATAYPEYQFMRWETVSGGAVIEDVYDMTTSFIMPQCNVSIRAVFGPNPVGYTYTVAGGKAIITGYTGSGDSAQVPDRIGGYCVTAIDDYAFCNETELKSIIIPDTVESVGVQAFAGCTSLKLIRLGKEVQNIGSGAFGYCPSLTEVLVSSQSNNYLSRSGVLYNKAGTELICCPAGLAGVFTVPEGVTSISDYAFYSCMQLKHVEMPDTALSIGEYSFRDCIRLESVVIPDSLLTIGKGGFEDCVCLDDLTLGDNTQSIGENAFKNCALSEVYFPRSLNAIGNLAFADNSGLTHAYFTGSMPSWGSSVFSGSAEGLKAYYHIGEAESWKEFYTYPKQAFCLLTTQFQNGQPADTAMLYLDEQGLIAQLPQPGWYDHTFEGWYKDAKCNDAWDLTNDVVSDDITLYAKWRLGPFEITGKPSSPYCGMVSGSGTYEAGTSVTLLAVPEEEYRFACWTKDGQELSFDAKYTFIAHESCEYTAEFEAIETPVITSIVYIGDSSIRLEWTKAAGAAGYEVWRSITKDGPFIKTADTETNSYVDKRLNTDTNYYYMINAYCCAVNVITYGEKSDAQSQKTAPIAPMGICAASAGHKAIKITWGNILGASGYQIFRSASKSGTYSLVYTTPSTYYTDTNLNTGTTYYYKVRAYDGTANVSSEFSEAAFCVPVPANVTGLRCSPDSVKSIKLSWGRVAGGDGYEIWRSESCGGGYSVIKTLRGTSFSDKGIVPNATYFYKVRAYSKVGKRIIPGDFSVVSSAKAALYDVTAAKASASSVTKIKISWGSVPGRKGYEIWRSESADSSYTIIGTTSRTYYTDKKCVPNSKYYYRIRAYVMKGRTKYFGGFSNNASAATVLGTVSGAYAKMYSVTSNRISWRPVPGRKGYEIWRSESADSGYTIIGTTSRTYYTDKKCVPNSKYHYRIRAYVMKGRTKYFGGFSNNASAATVLGTVSGAYAKMYSVTSNRISWRPVPGRKGYEIWRSVSPDNGFVLAGSVSKTYYTDKKLIPNRTYYYKVRAYAVIGKTRCYSGFSGVTSALPALGPLTAVSVRVSSPSGSRIAWKAVSGKSGYEILRSASPGGIYTVIGSTSRTYYYDKKCVPGTIYFYKVRAYKQINGVKYYGGESAAVSAAS